MTKLNEIEYHSSCWNKAKMDELLFILMQRDVAAPATIRFWVKERIRLGKNIQGDQQLTEALGTANEIDYQLGNAFGGD